MLRSLIAEGDLYPSDNGWQRKSLDQLRVPRSVEDAVRRRSEMLSPSAREVLTLAAVAGRRVDFALLQALSGFAEATLLDALKELLAAQLMIELPEDRFAFRHALTRQAIYAGLLARERRAWHARVAVAIESGAGGSADAVADLSYHLFEAEEWAKARIWPGRRRSSSRPLRATGGHRALHTCHHGGDSPWGPARRRDLESTRQGL